MEYDFSICKFCSASGSLPRYSIRRGSKVYCCPSCGAHYIDHLDDLEETDYSSEEAEEGTSITESEYDYLEKLLQNNEGRFLDKVDLLGKYVHAANATVLDVGAGGGLFLELLRKQGAEAHGIEPNVTRRSFAKAKYGISLRPELLGDGHWQDGFKEHFDAITLWDVIEHVNFPTQLLDEARSLLKEDGVLLLDTPARDAFYHRAGVFSYKMPFGRNPGFLNIMYSDDQFSHKQIFSSAQLACVLEQHGFELLSLRKIHELSFPYSFYLKRLLKSDLLAKVLEPAVSLFFNLFQIRNKIVIVARKTSRAGATIACRLAKNVAMPIKPLREPASS